MATFEETIEKAVQAAVKRALFANLRQINNSTTAGLRAHRVA